MATSRNRVIFFIVLFLVNAFWFQRGGIGMGSLITAEDITLRQATCEIVSMVCLAGASILFALLPSKKEIN